MLFGAGGVTRTHDLLITKCIRALHLTVFRDFGAFPLGILREVRPILSTVFVRSFSRVGHGVGQSFFPYTIGNMLHEIGQWHRIQLKSRSLLIIFCAAVVNKSHLAETSFIAIFH